MTRARVQDVSPDHGRARDLVEKARGHLGDLGGGRIGSASGYLLAYQACLDCMTAILLASGKRVRAGAGGHVEMIRAVQQEVSARADLLDELDASRAERNRVAYEGEDPSDSEVAALAEIATQLVDVASAHIEQVERSS
jgi:hypothetical protein